MQVITAHWSVYFWTAFLCYQELLWPSNLQWRTWTIVSMYTGHLFITLKDDSACSVSFRWFRVHGELPDSLQEGAWMWRGRIHECNNEGQVSSAWQHMEWHHCCLPWASTFNSLLHYLARFIAVHRLVHSSNDFKQFNGGEIRDHVTIAPPQTTRSYICVGLAPEWEPCIYYMAPCTRRCLSLWVELICPGIC